MDYSGTIILGVSIVSMTHIIVRRQFHTLFKPVEKRILNFIYHLRNAFVLWKFLIIFVTVSSLESSGLALCCKTA
jgi:hypothetical protein